MTKKKIIDPSLEVSVIVLGEGTVGKSALIHRYYDGTFSHEYFISIGTDFVSKKIKIDDKEITGKIWDTAGQERFRTITASLYKRADGILLVYDVTNQNSYEKLNEWFTSIQDNSSSRIPKYLICNKIDLNEKRVITKEEGVQAAKNFDFKYFETSAKEYIGVNEVFEEIIKESYKAKLLRTLNPTIVLEVKDIEKKQKKCC